MSPRDDEVATWTRHGFCRVPATGAGQRLDAYLARSFPYRSRTQWVALVKSGRVRVNDRRVRPSRGLRLGDLLNYIPGNRPEPRVSRAYRIVYEDPWLLAIRKPANLPVHPSGRYFRNTLLLMLAADRGEEIDTTELRIVHRLDRETSGLILFGKGRESAAALSLQFENREVRKEYIAIVHGRPDRDRFLVDAPIGPDPGSPVRKAMTVRPDGQSARTSFRVLRRGPEHALILARPHTGRLHQIRVHLRHAGYPIVGDKVYGRDAGFFIRFISDNLTAADRRELLWRRQALHALRIGIRHPHSGVEIRLRAPLGKGWMRLIERLEIRERV
jgi:23S rRNA pseudouridine1911/1915/1917 synthase